MKAFMDQDFLLNSPTARHLYHDYACSLPLVDYHCHISPQEIYEDRRFQDLTQVWLGGQNPDGTCSGDHYKWRLMRAQGIPEDYVTGNRPPLERFQKFAQALEMAIGNPMVHWCNLELRQFFGWQEPLTPANAQACWEFCSEKLQNDPQLSVRGMIQKANVTMIGTTDDPVDSLEWHRRIAEDTSFSPLVVPSFRPDKAIAIEKPGFAAYMTLLGESVGKKKIRTYPELLEALDQRLEYFHKLGCRASDHGLAYVPFRPCPEDKADHIFHRALEGEILTREEIEGYQTNLLLHLGRVYHRLGIVMQLHYSCLRNANHRLFQTLGPDIGCDTIAQNACGENIAWLLSLLDRDGHCPKTILYSLNPGDNPLLGALAGCFQSEEIPGKIQHGAAWWFNDTKSGMEDQMRSLANVGLLGNFVGMLTDSRSFLSYARHDYFRRILCNLLGEWVENGEYPAEEAALKKITKGICFSNAARYFGLDAEEKTQFLESGL